MDKKQKILVAVLAVVALGAGGYYFLRDSGSKTNRAAKATKAVRRVRKEAPKARKQARKVRKRQSGPVGAKVAVRKKRGKNQQKTAERRKKGRGKRIKIKKKTMAPAAFVWQESDVRLT